MHNPSMLIVKGSLLCQIQDNALVNASTMLGNQKNYGSDAQESTVAF